MTRLDAIRGRCAALQAALTEARKEIKRLQTICVCGKCGRYTVAGDCYGCETDRLQQRVEALGNAIESIGHAVKVACQEAEAALSGGRTG